VSDEWREGAKCRDIDPGVVMTLRVEFPQWNPKESTTELFYPPRDRALYKPIADEAKAVCNGKDLRPPCPVRDECLLDAIAKDDPHGIFGGKSHRERNALVRKLEDHNRSRKSTGKATMSMRRFISEGPPV
jgi:hypothetical protein